MNSISYGILCFDNSLKQVVLITRSISYAYFEVISALTKCRAATHLINEGLMDKMYDNEKRLLSTGNLELFMSHYRLELNSRSIKRKNQHLTAENLDLIKKALAKSKNATRPIIEIPKGHKRSGELPFDAALREFIEETNIPASKIRLFSDIQINYNFSDEGVNYRYNIYPAIIVDDSRPGHVDFSNLRQLQEILSVQWYSMAELRAIGFLDNPKAHLDYTARNARAIINIINQVKPLLKEKRVKGTIPQSLVEQLENDLKI